MKLVISAVFDSKAECFSVPIFTQARGVAVRGFSDAANNPDHDYGRHPADYTLFELGEYDQASGAVVMHDAKVNLGEAIQYVGVSE